MWYHRKCYQVLTFKRYLEQICPTTASQEELMRSLLNEASTFETDQSEEYRLCRNNKNLNDKCERRNANSARTCTKNK